MSTLRPVALSSSAQCVKLWNCEHESNLTPSKPKAASAFTEPAMMVSTSFGSLIWFSAQPQLLRYQPGSSPRRCALSTIACGSGKPADARARARVSPDDAGPAVVTRWPRTLVPHGSPVGQVEGVILLEAIVPSAVESDVHVAEVFERRGLAIDEPRNIYHRIHGLLHDLLRPAVWVEATA
jgi:hypothetical protein